jgi:hypothetical protein
MHFTTRKKTSTQQKAITVSMYYSKTEIDIKPYLVSVVVVLWLKGRTLHIGTIGTRHTGGLFAPIVINFHQVLDGFPIRKRTESFHLDAGLMDKHIGAAIVRLDETKALHGVEPLYSSFLDSLRSIITSKEAGTSSSERSAGRESGDREAAQEKTDKGQEITNGGSHHDSTVVSKDKCKCVDVWMPNEDLLLTDQGEMAEYEVRQAWREERVELCAVARSVLEQYQNVRVS